MDRIRYLAAGLLCVSGLIHVAHLGMTAELDTPIVAFIVAFGFAYLIIGGYLFKGSKKAYYFGAIVPLVSLCGGILGMLMNPNLLWAFLAAMDVVVIASCFYLIRKRRSA